MILRVSLICATLLTVSACSTIDRLFPPSEGAPQMVAEPDKVSAMLADAADRASSALQTLSRVEQERGPGLAAPPISNAPLELSRPVSVNWVGPADQITAMLAQRADYVFEAVGQAPAVPVVVSIDAEDKPVIEVLRSIGLQLGKRADVRVDANKKRIELHYAPNTGLL
ncbi:MAG: DotD/TraH family lipoprotein [Alphaproteobacteria bacterium]